MGCLSIIIIVLFISMLADHAYLIIPFGIIGVIVYRSYKKQKEKEAKERADKLELLSRKFRDEGLPTVSTSLVLEPREKCHYQAAGTRLITTRRVTRYEGGSRGVSVRVAKGLTLRGGSSRGRPIREDVTDRYPGEIAITNKRIAFLGSRGFEFKLEQITAIDYYADAIAFQVRSSRYVITSPEIDYIQIIIDAVMEGFELYSR